MTPFEYLRVYDCDRRVLRGDFYSTSPLRVEEGERVGVVLFNLGGPRTLDDVESFLYNLLMDPAVLDRPRTRWIRHWMAKALAHARAHTLRDHYEVIGGGSPLTRLTAEQSRGLQAHLNEYYGEPTGVDFRTYRAMRYWHPFSEEAAQQMVEDGIDNVVLLPLFPQYSASTTGSSLAYWNALNEAGEIPSWPTTAALEYAANPKYVQAISERIDEALQRFPAPVRDEVALIFSAHATPFRPMNERGDSYCCHVHSTVEQVMRRRDTNRPFHTAFQSLVGPSLRLSPSISEILEALADGGRRAVLIVPITFVTDHVNTSYELDIEARQRAESLGVDHFEVTAGLNTHPLFIEALGEATVAQLDLPLDLDQLRVGGDGLAQNYPLHPLRERPRHRLDGVSARCSGCGSEEGARRWTFAGRSSEPGGSPDRLSLPSDDASEQAPGAHERTTS